MEIEPIEGYRVRRALGAGSAGTAWLARDLASGRPVVLRRIPASDVAEEQAFRRDLALARGLDHRHAVRLADVRQRGREWVLVSDFVAAGSLADLLHRRSRLGTGELVTLLVPVAQALAAAHRVGLTHDHLGPGDILLTADGRPIVGDFGLRSVIPEPDRTDDLTALTRLARSTAADTATLPAGFFTGGFADIAARLLDLAPPRPIALAFGTTPIPEPRPPDARPRDPAVARRPPGAAVDRRRPAAAVSSPRRRPSTVQPRSVGRHRSLTTVYADRLPEATLSSTSVTVRRVRVLGIVAVGVSAVAVVIGLGLNASQAGESPAPQENPTTVPSRPGAQESAAPPSPPGGGSASVEVARWRTVLHALDAARARAFAGPDDGALDAVYQRGSVPWRADRSLLADYRDRSARVVGLRIAVDSIEVVDRTASSVVLRVTDRLTGGRLVIADGTTTALPTGAPTTRLITLLRTGPHWRIGRIAAAS